MTIDRDTDVPARGLIGVGVMLRALRERALLTQEQLAERSGVSVGTIRGVEAGRIRRPRSASIQLLVEALDLTGQQRMALTAVARGGAAEAAPPSDSPYRPTAVGAVVPAQLPAGLVDFTGRADCLKRLDELLPDDPVSWPATAVISAIVGMAGVGKTALAVHWAHRAADRFGDGQLYVNLHGYSAGQPLPPIQALVQLLGALGVEPNKVPEGVESAAALYRSLLAGRRVLVVLDNARDSAQVRPLLPGSAGCLVVVTSRDRLSGLVAIEAAYPFSLGLLSTAEARQLLARRLGRARVSAEPVAVDEIATWCARLPLALTIVAARVATHPDFPLAAVAAELRDTPSVLDALDDGEPATNVRAVFSCSYRTLGTEASRLFRLLGLHPGPDLAAPAAASLADVPIQRVRPLLAELARAHLIAEHTPGRYVLHDLLRAYATELTHTMERPGHSPTSQRCGQGRGQATGRSSVADVDAVTGGGEGDHELAVRGVVE
jgi:hypothetical protein